MYNFRNTTNDVKSTDIISIYITDAKVNRRIKDMVTSDVYYRGDNEEIRKRQMMMYDKSTETFVVDNSKTNNKLKHNFFGSMVNDKINYLLSKPMSYSCKDVKHLESVKEVLGNRFQSKISKLGKQASVKGISWLYVYINETGKLSYSVIPSEQIIPLWIDEEHEELQAVIRRYKVDTYEGKIKKVLTKVEYYTADTVEYYIENNGQLEVDKDVYSKDDKLIVDAERYVTNGNTNAHFTINGEGYAWGKVPFICIKNNDDELSDLYNIKSLIDAYDRTRSDVDNELEDIRNLIYVLKGYMSDGKDNLIKELKYSRVIATAEDGSLETINSNIDITSAKEHTNALKQDIIRFGGGVDKTAETISSNTSGIALRFLYAGLDLKCNQLEENIKNGFYDLMYFVREYILLTGGYYNDKENIDIVFNRDVIFNEGEAIEQCKNSLGIISKKTIVTNHPWIVDVEEELKQIEEEENREDMELSSMFDTREETEETQTS